MIQTEGTNWILTIPKQLVSELYIKKLVERLEFAALAAKNQMTEEQAWELSEEVKENWWKANREKFLKKINE